MDPTGANRVYADCVREAADGCHLAVRVVTRAGRTAIAGVRGGAVLVRLAAAPVDGGANATLITYVAGLVAVPRRAVRLVSGARSRDKHLLIAGLTASQVASRLAAGAE